MTDIELARSNQINDRKESNIDVQTPETPKKLSLLDRYLSLWILISCAFGLGIGQLQGTVDFIKSTSIGDTNILVAIGLIVMMYPPLSKVHWDDFFSSFKDTNLLILTVVLNWIIGPFLMFLLALLFFHEFTNHQGLMSGLSLVGCARCIAMVMVWNEISGGDNHYCASIVALNSLITIALYSPFAYLYIQLLPKYMVGLSVPDSVKVEFSQVALNVLIYMGIPFLLGVLTYFTLTNLKGKAWYFENFTPKIGPMALFALLFTIIILFASKSQTIISELGIVIYAIVPLLLYFLIMYSIAFSLSYSLNAPYVRAVTIAFTAASNNFELALAIAISSYTLQSDEALMSVVGALIEIPTMLALVHVSKYLRRTLYETSSPEPLMYKNKVELAVTIEQI